MSEHTPTPWHYQERSDAYTHILRAQNRFLAAFSQTSAPHSEANARLTVACVNAFHDPTGRTIATEDISEALFWRMYDALGSTLDSAESSVSLLDEMHRGPLHQEREELDKARALLSTLRVEEPENG